jgi:hypothetical protein
MKTPIDWQRELSECLESDFDSQRFERLQQELLINPELRNQFVRMRMLHSNLAEIFSIEAVGGMLDAELLAGEGAMVEFPSPDLSVHRATTEASNKRLLAVGFLVLAMSVFMVVYWPSPDGSRIVNVPSLSFAKITGVWNAIASDGQGDAGVFGQTLVKERRITLASGSVEVSLTSGVGILFEGPGQLEFISDRKAQLHSGQVVVHVPNGSESFELETSATLQGNQGSEFGAKITQGLDTEIQVFDGHVLASTHHGLDTRSRPHWIAAGDAVRISNNGTPDLERITYSPNRFLRHKDIPPGIEWPHETNAGSKVFKESQHASIDVPVASHGLIIDGYLDDWSPKAMIRSELVDTQSSRREQFDFGLRYDHEALYLAARVDDPFPLRSQIDPEMDPEFGWRGGGLQVRLSTDRELGWPIDSNSPEYFIDRKNIDASQADLDRAKNPKISHLTMWYHAASKQACLYIVHGMDLNNPKNKSQTQVSPREFVGRWQRVASDDGYTVEYRIPWGLLNAADDPPQKGDVLPFNLTVHWSCQAGRAWQNQVVEIRNPTEPAKIFTFERAATWGAAIFLSEDSI